MGKFNGLGIPFFGCAMLLLANIFFVLAFASPFWLTFDGSPDNSQGLWRKRRCLIQGTCYQFDIVGSLETYLDAVRGLMCLAIMLLPIPVVVVPIYLYVSSMIYYRRIMAMSAIFCLIAGEDH
ncbi:uncharacterized protein LOC115217289 [Octopus sinensis]|uniref:Uncharacterized protein LOC115217289 n=1 Tax=Octopus sinensis TaxID=2607531 RepID=A0A6P7SWX5_9MOLL|nr:uncharacterized protein LOC115217289 [Octopus sinensis]